jgi:hypothetical protein
MKLCKACGNECINEAKFCNECGEKLPEETTEIIPVIIETVEKKDVILEQYDENNPIIVPYGKEIVIENKDMSLKYSVKCDGKLI